MEQLFWPDLFVVGGGVSKKADKFLPLLKLNTPIVPAKLRNAAGIVGAAWLAQDRLDHPDPLRDTDVKKAAENQPASTKTKSK